MCWCQRPPLAVGCGFFQWRDPKMCSRAVNLILSLMECIEKHEEEKLALIEAKKQYRKWNWVLIMVGFGLIFFHNY